MNKGTACLAFKDAEAASAAIALLNGTNFKGKNLGGGRVDHD